MKTPTTFLEETMREFDEIYETTPTNRTALRDFIRKLLLAKDKEIAEAEKREWKRCVDVLDTDHSSCPLPQTCIGYQNALSDLMNSPPKSARQENLLS